MKLATQAVGDGSSCGTGGVVAFKDRYALKVFAGRGTSPAQHAAAWALERATYLRLGPHPNIIGLVASAGPGTRCPHGVLVLQRAACTLKTYTRQLFGGKAAGLPGPFLAPDGIVGRQLTRVLVAAGRGLAHMHAHGVVHLDVKPDNVLVTGVDDADGTGTDPGPEDVLSAGDEAVTAKLCDFGLAADVGKEVPCGSGTPGYLAPECVEGMPSSSSRRKVVVTPPIDVWAFGVVLWRTWTGGIGDTTMAVACDKVGGSIHDIARVVRVMLLTGACMRRLPTLRERRIVEWCLRPCGSARPSMPQLVAALESVSEGSELDIEFGGSEGFEADIESEVCGARALCAELLRVARAESRSPLPRHLRTFLRDTVSTLDEAAVPVQREVLALLVCADGACLSLLRLFETCVEALLAKRVAEALYLTYIQIGHGTGAPDTAFGPSGPFGPFGHVCGLLSVRYGPSIAYSTGTLSAP